MVPHKLEAKTQCPRNSAWRIPAALSVFSVFELLVYCINSTGCSTGEEVASEDTRAGDRSFLQPPHVCLQGQGKKFTKPLQKLSLVTYFWIVYSREVDSLTSMVQEEC